MVDTCAIDLTVQLPRSLAEQVQDVQNREPELLARMLMYTMARRTIFDRLTGSITAEHAQTKES